MGSPSGSWIRWDHIIKGRYTYQIGVKTIIVNNQMWGVVHNCSSQSIILFFPLRTIGSHTWGYYWPVKMRLRHKTQCVFGNQQTEAETQLGINTLDEAQGEQFKCIFQILHTIILTQNDCVPKSLIIFHLTDFTQLRRPSPPGKS